MLNPRLLVCLLPFILSSCDYLPSWMGGAQKEIVRLPGEREDVLGSQTQFKPDPSVEQAPFRLPAPYANNEWRQHTGIFTAGSGNLAGDPSFTSHQSASVGEGNDFSHTLVPRPVVANGIVFVMDSRGYISAHGLNNIEEKEWVSKALVTEDEDEVIGGGLAVEGNVLYATSGIGHIVAIDMTNGNPLWQRDLHIPLRSAPRVSDNLCFVISIDSQLFALDCSTGKTIWIHRGIDETAGIMNNVSPVVTGDMVIVPYASGEIYALQKGNGDEIWRESMAQANRTEATAIFSGIGGDPVVDGAVVMAVSSSGLFSVFNLLNGIPVWEKQLGSINTPWLAGDYVYALSDDNTLIAMVKYDGRIRWTVPLRRYIDEERSLRPILWHGPIMMDGQIIVVSTHGEIKVVDAATGDITTTIEAAEDVDTAPIIADGKLLVVDKEATLHSYQ